MDQDDPTEQPRWGRVGKQRIEDTGPLTKKRLETCDDEFVAAAKDFQPRQKAASFTIDQALEKMSEAASGAGH
jgi:arylsulfatase